MGGLHGVYIVPVEVKRLAENGRFADIGRVAQWESARFTRRGRWFKPSRAHQIQKGPGNPELSSVVSRDPRGEAGQTPAGLELGAACAVVADSHRHEARLVDYL